MLQGQFPQIVCASSGILGYFKVIKITTVDFFNLLFLLLLILLLKVFLVLTKVFIIFWAPAISRYNINIGSHHTDVGIPEVPWLFGSC